MMQYINLTQTRMNWIVQNGQTVFLKKINTLIIATCHNSSASGKSESILVDIDLSILGADPKEYRQYSDAIRKEYKLIPSLIYRKKRKSILNNFLSRPQIFQNKIFYNNYETQARTNINNEIDML